MDIYHLAANLDDTVGGPAKSIPYLVKELNKLGVNNYLLSVILKQNETNELIEKYNLNWKNFSTKFIKESQFSPNLKNYLIRSIKDKNSIIVHSHSLWKYVSLISFKLSIKNRIPFIISLRGSIELNNLKKKIAWKFFQRNIFQNSNAIHVTNKKDIFKLRNLEITAPIALIPNGIDLNQFKFIESKDELKKKLGLNRDKKYILFLSRIHKGKGLSYLVNAWCKIANHFLDWDLLIVGPVDDVKYYNETLSLIDKFNLNQRVNFTGMLKKNIKMNYYGASDLFVLPSYSENFGMAIAEAMASKLPVITTKGTPWHEIDHYGAGWYVNLNQKQIDDSLKDALTCKKIELEKKGLNAYKLIQKYDSKYQAIKIKKVYDWMLGIGTKPDFIF